MLAAIITDTFNVRTEKFNFKILPPFHRHRRLKRTNQDRIKLYTHFTYYFQAISSHSGPSRFFYKLFLSFVTLSTETVNNRSRHFTLHSTRIDLWWLEILIEFDWKKISS